VMGKGLIGEFGGALTLRKRNQGDIFFLRFARKGGVVGGGFPRENRGKNADCRGGKIWGELGGGFGLFFPGSVKGRGGGKEGFRNLLGKRNRGDVF